ncbi:MAG TPA: SIMPL domain-containing protein, partial [Firmicutes bacterium]|nr:SIMPL domain-containing protein [Bacillota bacterium]
MDTIFDWVDRRRIFRGYKASHKLKVQFPFDKDYLKKIMQRLSQTKSHASFRLSFTIADPEPLRQQALIEAVKNAAQKARVLAEAAGVKLG